MDGGHDLLGVDDRHALRDAHASPDNVEGQTRGPSDQRFKFALQDRDFVRAVHSVDSKVEPLGHRQVPLFAVRRLGGAGMVTRRERQRNREGQRDRLRFEHVLEASESSWLFTVLSPWVGTE